MLLDSFGSSFAYSVTDVIVVRFPNMSNSIPSTTRLLLLDLTGNIFIASPQAVFLLWDVFIQHNDIMCFHLNYSVVSPCLSKYFEEQVHRFHLGGKESNSVELNNLLASDQSTNSNMLYTSRLATILKVFLIQQHP